MFLNAEDFNQFINTDETMLKMAMFNPPDRIEFFKEIGPEYFDANEDDCLNFGGIMFTGPDVNDDYLRIDHNVALGKIYQYNDGSFACEMVCTSQSISASTMLFIVLNRDKLFVNTKGNWSI